MSGIQEKDEIYPKEDRTHFVREIDSNRILRGLGTIMILSLSFLKIAPITPHALMLNVEHDVLRVVQPNWCYIGRGPVGRMSASLSAMSFASLTCSDSLLSECSLITIRAFHIEREIYTPREELYACRQSPSSSGTTDFELLLRGSSDLIENSVVSRFFSRRGFSKHT